MKATVHEILNHHITNYKDEIVHTHTVEADDINTLIKKIYSFERSSRYDSGRRYEIVEDDIREQYNHWKQYNMTIDDFYGSAIVD